MSCEAGRLLQQTPQLQPSKPTSTATPPILVNATLAAARESSCSASCQQFCSQWPQSAPFSPLHQKINAFMNAVKPRNLPCPDIDNNAVDPATLMPPGDIFKPVFVVDSRLSSQAGSSASAPKTFKKLPIFLDIKQRALPFFSLFAAQGNRNFSCTPTGLDFNSLSVAPILTPNTSQYQFSGQAYYNQVIRSRCRSA